MDSDRRILNALNDGPGSRIHGGVQIEDNVVELNPEPGAPLAPLSFEELFLDVHDRLYRALYFITGSSADAEELMQDAFLKVWERWDQVGAMNDPVGYLYRTAMNLFRKRYRRAVLAIRRSIGLASPRDDFADAEDRDEIACPRQRQ